MSLKRTHILNRYTQCYLLLLSLFSSQLPNVLFFILINVIVPNNKIHTKLETATPSDL